VNSTEQPIIVVGSC